MAKARVLQDKSDPGVVLDELLLQSWEIAMRAERKSPRTIRIYLTQARTFMAWCASLDSPARFDRRTVQAFLAAEADRGLSPNTVVTRYTGLRQLAVWLRDEGETSTMVMEAMKEPSTTYVPPDVMSDDDIRTLIRACEGTRFYDRRDLACLRLLLDTGARASEVVDLRLCDVNLRDRLITVVGKGDRVRTVPFGDSTARALDRYLRARHRHAHSASDRLWVGERGPWTYDGIADALRTRARAAGAQDFHPHLLRHTLAHRWLAKGGSEQGLMDVAGWRSREMIARYGASGRAERAAAVHRRLGRVMTLSRFRYAGTDDRVNAGCAAPASAIRDGVRSPRRLGRGRSRGYLHREAPHPHHRHDAAQCSRSGRMGSAALYVHRYPGLSKLGGQAGILNGLLQTSAGLQILEVRLPVRVGDGPDRRRGPRAPADILEDPLASAGDATSSPSRPNGEAGSTTPTAALGRRTRGAALRC